MPAPQRFSQAGESGGGRIGALCCVKVRQQEEGEGTDMCKAWEDMMQEVAEWTTKEVEVRAAKEAEQTVKETEERTILQNIRNVMDPFHVTADQAMAALKIPEGRLAELITRL